MKHKIIVFLLLLVTTLGMVGVTIFSNDYLGKRDLTLQQQQQSATMLLADRSE